MNRLNILLILLLISAMSCAGKDECNPSRKYLVVTPYAGMANRLRVLASAKIMAALTDRHLVVLWSEIPNEMPGQWKDFFLNPLTMFAQSPLPEEGCTLKRIMEAPESDPIIKNLGRQNNEGRTGDEKTLGKITEYNEPIVYFETSYSFAPETKYMSDREYRQKYRTFYQSLDPYLWVSDAVKKFERDHNFDNFFMVGVHYRAWTTGTPDETQGVTTDKQHRYLNDFVNALKAAMNKPLSQTDYKPVAFFLATDDPQLKEKLSAIPEFKGRIFTRDVKIDRSTIHGQQSALVDWFLLGATNYIIGTTHSSFSDEAAHLTKQGQKIHVGDSPYKKP